MAIYKFPQFNVEIENPTISIDLNTISDKALEKLLSVDVLLQTETASFGVRAENMTYLTWDDQDVQGMVNEWIKQYEV